MRTDMGISHHARPIDDKGRGAADGPTFWFTMVERSIPSDRRVVRVGQHQKRIAVTVLVSSERVS